MTLPALPTSRAGWSGLRAVVHGSWTDGFAAADNLLFLGADVMVLGEDALTPDDARAERVELLTTLGADIRLGPGMTAVLPEGCDLLVAAECEHAGESAEGPLEAQADARGVPVWSVHELAWRLRAEDAAPWLVVATHEPQEQESVDAARGIESIARAAGLRARVSTLNAGAESRLSVPIVEAVMDPEQPDVLAVVLGARQLARSTSIRAESAAVLHSGDPALARAYDGVRFACVYNVADPGTEHYVEEAEVVEGARAIGISLATPLVSMLGVVDEFLVDRAFIAERRTSAAELATLADLWDPAVRAPHEPPPAVLRAALTAAALTRAHGLSQAAVRDGLRAWATVDSSGND